MEPTLEIMEMAQKLKEEHDDSLRGFLNNCGKTLEEVVVLIQEYKRSSAFFSKYGFDEYAKKIFIKENKQYACTVEPEIKYVLESTVKKIKGTIIDTSVEDLANMRTRYLEFEKCEKLFNEKLKKQREFDVFFNKQKLENKPGMCCACKEKASIVVLMPCKHQCLCETCHGKIKENKCPICRCEIETFIKPHLN